MGRKTILSIQILVVALFVMLLVTFLFTSDIILTEPEDDTAVSTGEVSELEDGVYTGSAEGHNGPIELEVTIENNEISDIVILDHSETEDLSDPAFDEVPAAIIENNSTDVDVVSGVTVTSDAIIEAVDNILADASTADVSDIEDGVYTGSAEGHNGPIELEVTIENNEISDIVILDHSETEDLADPAFDEVPAAIIENNSTDVDVVSGVTVTSDAIIEAVENILNNQAQ